MQAPQESVLELVAHPSSGWAPEYRFRTSRHTHGSDEAKRLTSHCIYPALVPFKEPNFRRATAEFLTSACSPRLA